MINLKDILEKLDFKKKNDGKAKDNALNYLVAKNVQQYLKEGDGKDYIIHISSTSEDKYVVHTYQKK